MKNVIVFAALAMSAGMVALGAGNANPAAQATGSARNVNTPGVRVRYIVNDVAAAVAFYTNHLNFNLVAESGPYFAIVARDNLQLVLSPPKGPGGASQPMPDGRRPEAGGWDRIIIPTENIESEVDSLKRAGVKFRNNIVSGPGGREIILEDPSGNPIELFEASH